MATQAVQFRGKEQVINAYKSKKIGAWSLFCQKQMLHKCEDEDSEAGAVQLNAWLDMMGTTSTAIYTLKVYENVPDGGIKDNTACDGSFNFYLAAAEQLQIGTGQANSPLMQLLQKQQSEIAELRAMLEEEDDEEEDTEQDTIGKIERVLQMPAINGLIGKIFNIDTSQGLGKVSGVHNEQQLQDALKLLRQKDPAFSARLWKLAQIADKKPDTYTYLAGMLDQMQV